MDETAANRRDRLFSLVHNQFAGNTDVVANVIEQSAPGAKVSVRSIQAWLMPSDRASSRNCPPWALKALEDFVADPQNRPRLDAWAQMRDASVRKVATPFESSDKVFRQRSVEIATSQIEEDERALHRWQDQLGKETGRYVFELEKRLLTEQRGLSESLAALHQAVYFSSSFEEFKAGYLERARAILRVHGVVKDTRKHIEGRSQEFATDDAVMEPPVKQQSPL